MLALTLLLLTVQQTVPEITLGPRTGAISEPFSDAMGMAEVSDGRVIVSDRVEKVFSLADFNSGARRTIGRNGTGPNEYQLPFGPIRWRGDTLLGYDPNNRRFLRILPDGEIRGAFPFPTVERKALPDGQRRAGSTRRGGFIGTWRSSRCNRW
jgi:hypothetical protein